MSDIVPDRSGYLQIDDHELWWEYHGDGSREAVVLLNGLAMSTASWYSFLPQLADAYDVVLYDYLGQGQSSKEDIPYSITDFAHYLARIMDEVGQQKIHVMGISYGGFIALEFARLYDERVHTLLLSGILASHERLFEMYQEISLRFYRSTPEVFAIYTHYMYEKIFGESFVAKLPPASLDTMRQRFYDRYVDHRHCLIRLTEAQDPFFAALDEHLPGYAAISAPTLVMAGDQDRAIPLWQQKKLCELIPDSRWLEIPDAGHVVYLEQPAIFFGAMRRLMAAKNVDFDVTRTEGARKAEVIHDVLP